MEFFRKGISYFFGFFGWVFVAFLVENDAWIPVVFLIFFIPYADTILGKKNWFPRTQGSQIAIIAVIVFLIRGIIFILH